MLLTAKAKKANKKNNHEKVQNTLKKQLFLFAFFAFAVKFPLFRGFRVVRGYLIFPSFTDIAVATSATYLLKGGDLGKYFKVKITNANGGNTTSAAIGEVKYGIVVQSNPDLTIKFGMRTFEPLGSDMVAGALLW